MSRAKTGIIEALKNHEQAPPVRAETLLDRQAAPADLVRWAAWAHAIDRHLLPRVLRNPANLDCGVALSPAVAAAYGRADAPHPHPSLLEAVRAIARAIDPSFVLPDVRDDDARVFTAMPWYEAASALLIEFTHAAAMAPVVEKAIVRGAVSPGALSFFAAAQRDLAVLEEALLAPLTQYQGAWIADGFQPFRDRYVGLMPARLTIWTT